MKSVFFWGRPHKRWGSLGEALACQVVCSQNWPEPLQEVGKSVFCSRGGPRICRVWKSCDSKHDRKKAQILPSPKFEPTFHTTDGQHNHSSTTLALKPHPTPAWTWSACAWLRSHPLLCSAWKRSHAEKKCERFPSITCVEPVDLWPMTSVDCRRIFVYQQFSRHFVEMCAVCLFDVQQAQWRNQKELPNTFQGKHIPHFPLVPRHTRRREILLRTLSWFSQWQRSLCDKCVVLESCVNGFFDTRDLCTPRSAVSKIWFQRQLLWQQSKIKNCVRCHFLLLVL